MEKIYNKDKPFLFRKTRHISKMITKGTPFSDFGIDSSYEVKSKYKGIEISTDKNVGVVIDFKQKNIHEYIHVSFEAILCEYTILSYLQEFKTFCEKKHNIKIELN